MVSAKSDGPLRHCIEVRHDSFATPRFFSMLKANDVALVVAETANRFPMFDETTDGFHYVRLHGATKLYQSRYTNKALAAWGERVTRWQKLGRDVYLYFDNDFKVHAPFDAARLREWIGGQSSPKCAR